MNTAHRWLRVSLGLGLACLLGTLVAWGIGSGRPQTVWAQGPDGQATYYVALSCLGMPTPCFTSVQAAVDVADAADDVIKVATGLYTDVHAREGVTQTVYLSKTVTIQGGYTVTDWTTPNPALYPTVLSALGNGRVVYIVGSITPTLAGLRLAGGNATGLGGYFDPDTLQEYDGGGAVYAAYATPTITNCQIDNSGAEAGGGIALFESDAIIRNSAIMTNQAGYGGGLALGRSAAIVDGNTFAGNTAGYGGGLGVGQSAAQITNNTLRANDAVSSGGGIALIGNPAATVRGNLIVTNTARWGGGVVISSSAASVMSNTITDNYADEVGGGVNLDHCDARLVGNAITANTAGSSGGGLYFVASTAVLTRNQVLSNTAGESGGGVYIDAGRPRLAGNTLRANTANEAGGGLAGRYNAAQILDNLIAQNTCLGTGIDLSGGGVYLRASDGARLAGNRIVENNTLYYGGGVYLNASDATLENNVIATNTVNARYQTGGGGGVYINASDTAALNHNLIAGNVVTGQSDTVGGGVYLRDSDAQLAANRIVSNDLQTAGSWSSVYGGGVYVEGASPTLSQNEILSNTARWAGGDYGGGVFLASGTTAQVLSNTIAFNRSDWSGGVFLESTASTVTGNRIFSNRATFYGGGLFVNYGTNVIQRNLILSNTADIVGGGLALYQAEDNWIANNILAANHAAGSNWFCVGGAGVAINYAGPPLLHNTIVSNTGSAGLCFDGRSASAGLPMTNTIIAHHATGVYLVSGNAALESTLWYSNATEWAGGGTMNNAHPLAGDPAFVNPAAHNYHIGLTSAALDVGADSGVADDIDGDARPANTGYDVGVDERPGASLRIVKSAAPPAVNLGGSVTYTLVISSVGATNASGVLLTDTLPTLARALSVQASQGTCTLDSGWGAVVTCTLGALNVGAHAVVTLTAEVTTTLPAVMPARLRNGAQTRASNTFTMTAEAIVWMQDCHARLNDDLTDYTSVQAAVDAATQPGDVVKVAGACVGVNTLGGLRQQVYLTKTLTIRGGYTPGDWTTSDPAAHPTVLDALGQGRVVYVSGAVAPTLAGLTFQNGDATGLGGYAIPWSGEVVDSGGGIAVVNAAATVTNCQVYSSTARFGGGGYLLNSAGGIVNTTLAGHNADDGGGLYLASSPATVTGNAIRQNAAINGGGVYLNGSDATVSRNTVTSNTVSNRGGGVYLTDGAPTLSDNTLTGNTAGSGGGVFALGDDALITGNLIAGNDGEGGGLYHQDSRSRVSDNTISANYASSYGGGVTISSSAARYTGNRFLDNTAYSGGGVYIYGNMYAGDAASFIGNTFTGNAASNRGGGLYLEAGSNLIRGNLLMSNTAQYGGGAYLQSTLLNSVPQLVQAVGNTVMSNTATLNGGGLYLSGPRPYLRNNVLRGNRATSDGGGLYVRYQSYERLINTVIVDNRAGENGSGIYIAGASPRLLHTTLARNVSETDQVVYLDSYNSGGTIYSHPVFTNTILANSDVGFYINSDNSAELNGILWYSVTTHSTGDGAITVTHEITGDPAFDADGYHLLAGSAALDQGVNAGVTDDVDAQPRPLDWSYDLGADEYPGIWLAVAKRASSIAAPFDRPITYTIVVTSMGLSSAPGVVLTDTLDAWQQVSAATASQGACTLTPGWGGGTVCTLGSIPSQAVVVVTVTAQISPSVPSGQALVNTARATSAGTSAQAETTVYAVRPPVANFSGTPRTGDRPLLVTFTDLSTGNLTEWLWRFGDGATAATTNPTHTYTIAGVYTVSLRVSGPGGSDALTRTAYITVTEPVVPVSHTLTITQTGSGHGVVTPTVGAQQYLSGTTVLVTATAQADSTFAGWSGACSGASPTCTVLLNADKRLTATFTLKPVAPVSYTLTLTQTGSGRGVVTPTVGAQQYLSGTTVLVTATAQADSTFAGWSGACSGAAPTCTVLMNADKLLTATFTLKPVGPVSYTLTITQTGDGAGTLTPGVGAHEYLSGTTVLVTATAQAGSAFVGWSGAAVGATNPISVVMTADKVLTATFRALTYTLTVDTVGEGTVTRTPSQTTYLYGDVVTLTATPDAGRYFGQWSGDAGGTLTQTTVAMTANRLVTATFLSTQPTYYTLTMGLVGSGGVTPTVGAHSYLSGSIVPLSASPAAGWQFAGWTGDLESSANPAQITLNADKAVTATFTLKPVSYTLTIATAGNGRGTVTPGVGAHEYLSGTTALITATAQADSDFAGWSGACSGMSSTCAVLMNADKAVTATFTLKAVNGAPVANAGADQSVEPGASVTLDGSASSDSDGNLPLTYFWRQTGGPAVSFTPTLSRTTFFAPETPTVLTFTLTVTDSLGLADLTPDAVVITVGPYTVYLPFVIRNQ